MQLVCKTRVSLGMGILIGVSLGSALSYAGTTKDGFAPIEPANSDIVVLSVPVRAVELNQAPVVGDSAMALRTIPTLSTQVLVGGLTLMPYVAAGFGGGYVTERDRVLHSVPVASSLSSPATIGTIGLRSHFGPHLFPNEVHLGIRVPF